ncbi:phosphoglycolate phosphatase [Thermogladius sp. 4427co]|uniref:phosphoglycolate phosphatase n=1 Tax=Thermogladius sp. 4427co TaxID=3450718 RepID=UPI003F7AC317
MARIKIIFTDLDGTLTESRRTYRISLQAVEAIRRVQEKGVLVSIVSSNAIPVVIGLHRYLDLKGPAIGETGALVYSEDWGLIELSSRSAREAYLDVLERFKGFVNDSWQNRFRLYDFALRVARGFDGEYVYKQVKEYVESRYDWVRTGYSKYAIHLTPSDVSKGRAVRFVLEKLGLSIEEAAGVGDSSMDIDLLESVGLGVATGDADDELKSAAHIVLDAPAGLAIAKLVEMIEKGSL